MGRLRLSLLVVLTLVLAPGVLAAPAHAAELTPSQYEAQLAAYVNQARARAGLPAVTVSASLSRVARSWSTTMASTGDFRHNPRFSAQYPDGWTAAAENIAWGYGYGEPTPPTKIHDGFMASSGHRANILAPGTTHVGLGVAYVTRSGREYVYVTQNFARYPSGTSPDGSSSTTLAYVPPDAPFDQIVTTPDFSGNGVGDVVASDQNGRLYLYPGTGRARLGTPRLVGTGWSGLDVYAPGDWNGDRRNDLVAVDARGRLFLHRGDGRGGFRGSGQIGHGWTGFRIVPAGDIDGDRAADILAIDSGDRLWLYRGDGSGGFKPRKQVGYGWDGFDLYAAGDMNRDGRADIVSIDRAGRLWFYAGRGGGYFRGRVQAGYGWSGYAFASGADLDADGLNDLLGRDTRGRLWLYSGRVGGRFAMKVQVGSGW